MGLVFLHRVLVKRKIRVWTTDVRYSVAFAFLAALCLFVPRLVLPGSPDLAETCRNVLSIVVISGVGTFAILRIVAVVR